MHEVAVERRTNWLFRAVVGHAEAQLYGAGYWLSERVSTAGLHSVRFQCAGVPAESGSARGVSITLFHVLTHRRLGARVVLEGPARDAEETRLVPDMWTHTSEPEAAALDPLAQAALAAWLQRALHAVGQR